MWQAQLIHVVFNVVAQICCHYLSYIRTCKMCTSPHIWEEFYVLHVELILLKGTERQFVLLSFLL